MKKSRNYTVVFSLVSLLILLSSKVNHKPDPPYWGLCGITNEFVVDETEICMGEWMEFLYYNPIDSNPIYWKNSTLRNNKLPQFEKKRLLSHKPKQQLLPDSSLIRPEVYQAFFSFTNDKRLVEYKGLKGIVSLPVNAICFNVFHWKKHEIIDYLNLPVRGISYSQVQKFIHWRNQWMERVYHKKVYENGGDSPWLQYYHFRLPKPEEFNRYNPNWDSLVFNRNKPLQRFMFLQLDSVSETVSVFNNPFNHFKVNHSNPFASINNAQGNVAEMTQIEGVAMGGSYQHYASESYNSRRQAYKKPMSWLGFRCVGIGKKKK
jgi:hypothetical protein